MGHVPLLDELAVVAAVAVLVTVLLARLKLPTVAGLLSAGALVGPFGLRWAPSVTAIEVLAEVGVVLLLFSIGLELSLRRLRDIMKSAALGGSLQVGLTLGLTFIVASALGQSASKSLFWGFAFALSSTAIVLRALSERSELDAPHGRFIVGTLIFQDLCVVPMVLIVPLLGSGETIQQIGLRITLALGQAVLVVVSTVVVARFVVPRILDSVDASRSREIFLLAILGLCIGTAWLTSLAGLSLALGAFLGGLIVADTEYGHRAMGDILPLRDAFVSIFFVSLGMLFDYQVVLRSPALIALLLAGFLLVKGLLATLAAMAMRFPARVAWLSGVGLAQFGEFGFVLTRLAEKEQLITSEESAPLLAAGILSMFLTPLLARAAPHFTAGERLLAPLERLIGVRGIGEADRDAIAMDGHVIIIGFGLGGRLAAESLVEQGVPFVVLELNAENVRRGKALGYPVYYADATSQEALHHAHAERARLVIVLINDPSAVERIVGSVKRAAPDAHLLLRARYLAERKQLVGIGVDDVVAEEVESAVEIISRVLQRLGVPRNAIDDRLRRVRADLQASDRKLTVRRRRVGDLHEISDLQVECLVVAEGARISGLPGVLQRLHAETGAYIVGVRRGKELIQAPDPAMCLELGDVVYLVGTGAALVQATHWFGVIRSEAPPRSDGLLF
jgi:monovalent cation:H+ antiporter-2, CPA2 family